MVRVVKTYELLHINERYEYADYNCLNLVYMNSSNPMSLKPPCITLISTVISFSQFMMAAILLFSESVNSITKTNYVL